MRGAIRADWRASKADETGETGASCSRRAFLAVVCAAIPAVASAQSSETAVTIPGNPLTVYVGPRGECQSSYLVHGEVVGNFSSEADQVGDCGFFLVFRKVSPGEPVELQGKTFGFDGQAGPHGHRLHILPGVSRG